MRYKKRNGLYLPQYDMKCMGLEDPFPPNPKSNITALRKGVTSPSGGGGSTSGSAGSAPVTNGEIGSTTNTQTTYAMDGTYAPFRKITPTTAGTVNYGHAYISVGDGGRICLSIHDSSGAQLAYGQSSLISGDGGQWVNVTLNTSVTLVGATTYWLVIQGDATGVTAWEAIGGVADITSYWEPVGGYKVPPGSVTDGGTLVEYSILCLHFDNTSGSP